MSETLFIETTLLNSFVGEDSWVVVKARDGYARKKGRDLQVGDRVVVANEGIDKTLEEVEPVLEESVRYRVARDTVYATSQRGRRVPVFRKLLLEGVANPATENLEAKVFREGGADFTEHDYRGFRAAVLSYVDVAESTVGAWLKGEVLASRDWGQFAKLVPVHPGFQALADSYEQDVGFHNAYALYVGTRRTIMGYLAKRGKKQRKDADHPPLPGTPGDEDNGGDSGGVGGNVTRGKYAAEISLVVSRFMEEIDDTTSAARVTKILTSNGKKHGTPYERKHPDPHLKKGVVVEHFDTPTRSMNDLAREQYILQQALFDTCNQFYMRLIDETLGEEDRQELTQGGLTENTKLAFTLPILTPYTVVQLLPHTTQFERTILSINRYGLMQMTGRMISEEELDKILKRAYEAFETHLRSGQIDAWLGTEPNTISTIIDYAREYASLLPKAHFDRVGVIGSLKYANAKHVAMKNASQKQGTAARIRKQKEQVQDLVAKERKLAAYLHKTYGMLEDLSRHKSFFFAYHNDRLGLQGVQPEEVEAQSRDDLLVYKSQYEAAGKQFLTRTGVRLFLTRLGIPSAINVYEKRNWVV